MMYSALYRAAVLPAAFSCLLMGSCTPRPSATRVAAAPNRFAADSVLRRIATSQDERRTGVLLLYLTNSNTAYRQAAAEALASVQDKTATPSLLTRLQDPEPSVRRAAAYALGQTADSTAEAGLTQRISTDPDVRFAVAQKIVRRASDYGIPASDIVVDPLVLPIGAMGTAGRQVFALLRRLVTELKVNPTCGASNVSFGLPDNQAG